MLGGLWLLGGGVGAGFFGSLLGLGGGTLIVPLLTLVFNLPLLTAVGVSLVCVIVASGASAGVFLERRELGMAHFPHPPPFRSVARPAAPARLQPAVADRSRGQPRLRDRDERRVRGRVPRAP